MHNQKSKPQLKLGKAQLTSILLQHMIQQTDIHKVFQSFTNALILAERTHFLEQETIRGNKKLMASDTCLKLLWERV